MGRLRATASRVIQLGLAGAVAVGLGVALAEGIHSLVTGHSLVGRLSGLARAQRVEMLDEERLALAARTEGPFALTVDPEVGFRMNGRLAREVFGTTVATDAHGQRARKGPPAGPGATRIVLLGDSFAFGFGVEDEQTFAWQLESLLAGTMAAGAPRPVVETVACPGWNAHNAVRYLEDHLARLDPRVVLFLTVGNDLHDSFATTEVGHRSLAFDPLVGAARPHVSVEAFDALLQAVEPRVSTPEKLAIWKAGGLRAIPHAILTGILPESERRWRGLLADVEDLRTRLAARDGKLAVCLLWMADYELLAEHLLAESTPDLEVIPTFRDQVAGDTLPNDGHPNARTIRAAAFVWCARLLALGWVPGAGARPLPPPDPSFAARHAERRGKDERLRWLAASRQNWKRFMATEVDLDRGRGFTQVYGGLSPDGTVGKHLWFGLLNDGASRLELRLERLPLASGLYPLALKVELGDGAPRILQVPAPASAEDRIFCADLPVPPAQQREPTLEVLVTATNWIVEEHAGQSRLAAFRFRRAALLR